MKNLLDLVKEIADRRIQLWLEEGESGGDPQLKFKAPKYALDDALKQQIKEQRDELIHWLLESKRLSTEQAIEKVERNQVELLPSYEQRALWFQHHFDTNKANYNNPLIIEIKGQLNLDALTKCYQHIIDTQEVFRTSFYLKENELDSVTEQFDTFETEQEVERKAEQETESSPNSSSHYGLRVKVHGHYQLEPRFTDLSAESQESANDKLQLLIRADTETVFDLSCLPLFNFAVVQMPSRLVSRQSQNHYFLLATMHHMLTDAWSMGRFVTMLEKLYPSFADQGASAGKFHKADELNKETPNIQYVDYAHWQYQKLDQKSISHQQHFWKHRLADIEPLVIREQDKHTATIANTANNKIDAGEQLSIELSDKRAQGIKYFATKYKLSTFSVYFALYALLLNKYSGQKHFAIATPVANRDKFDLELLLGFFVNTLVVPVSIDSEKNLDVFVTQFAESFKSLAEYKDLPYELVRQSLRETSPSELSSGQDTLSLITDTALSNSSANYQLGDSLFNSMFSVETIPKTILDFEGCQFSLAKYQKYNSKFDLSLTVLEHASKNSKKYIRITYKTQLFSSAFVNNIAKHYLNLIDRLLLQEKQFSFVPISHIKLLNPTEEKRYSDWGITQDNGEFPNDCNNRLTQSYYACFLDTLTETLRKQRKKPALYYARTQISYEKLFLQVENCAKHLVSLGLGTGSTLGLLMPRSARVPVLMLACAKLGIQFIPFNITWPKSQVITVLRTIKADALYFENSTKLKEKWSEDDQKKGDDIPLCNLINGDKLHLLYEIEIADSDNHNLLMNSVSKALKDAKKQDSNLGFFIIYSSGTTGEAKASQLSQRNFVAFTDALANKIHQTERDISLQACYHSFDGGLNHLLSPLIHGGSVVIPEAEEGFDFDEFVTLCEQHRITLTGVVPSVFNLLSDVVQEQSIYRTKLSSLKTFLVGGEPLKPKSLAVFNRCCPNTNIYSTYGPSECSIISVVHLITPQDFVKSVIPLGRVLQNSQALVVDQELNLVPQGVSGL